MRSRMPFKSCRVRVSRRWRSSRSPIVCLRDPSTPPRSATTGRPSTSPPTRSAATIDWWIGRCTRSFGPVWFGSICPARVRRSATCSSGSRTVITATAACCSTGSRSTARANRRRLARCWPLSPRPSRNRRCSRRRAWPLRERTSWTVAGFHPFLSTTGG